MRLWLLGTGTPTPSVRRMCSGYLVEAGGGEGERAQFDRPGMRERVLREICEVFKGDVFFGEDLMEIPFTSQAAAKLD